jgi:fermentation-respiration switch protein FrsA (DUF1100 family)
MLRRSLLRTAAAALAAPAILGPRAARALEPVDVELILAVDVSRSVDAEEMELQMRGYAAAFRDRRLIGGVAAGPIGAIACMMFLWSDHNIQQPVIPWTRIGSPAEAEGFARAVDAAPRNTFLYTSISGAMTYAGRQFGQRFEGTRQVLDISGDGVNNSGRPVEEARAELLAQGVVINGLPVLDRAPPPAGFQQPPLDEYYRDSVIGGPGAFVMVAEGFDAFDQAARRKIIREIAGVPGPGTERAFA